MYELIERTSCAGCDVTVNDKRLNEWFKEHKGEVGYTSDKSVQLLFPTERDRAEFERKASAIGVIFD